MKETILYISKSEQDIQSFLKYLQSKLKAEQRECTLDEKHSILKVPKYYDIVGNIKDTVEIVDIIKPIYNFKANE